MDNPETLTTFGTQDPGWRKAKQIKNKRSTTQKTNRGFSVMLSSLYQTSHIS